MTHCLVELAMICFSSDHHQIRAYHSKNSVFTSAKKPKPKKRDSGPFGKMTSEE